MIYVDASVALARLFAEDVRPPETLWDEPALASSRLLEYELWTRVNARGSGETLRVVIEEMLGRLSFLELSPPVLAWALDPLPLPVRTLDALHLSTIEYLRNRGQQVELASYDRRMSGAAEALGIPLVDLRAF
ncbi:MAG: PIN domain-containing protein [Actinomycetota bacterium]